ncbi:MAG: DUF3313 family protein [Bdellovibrionales bacterium]|nr:DUF3313 family protein [Bdellovibrionales bacterium]
MSASLMLRCIFALILGLSVSGCSLLKASAAPNAGFLPKPELLSETSTRSPFHASWMIEAARYMELRKHYKSIVIAPISTTYVDRQIDTRYSSERLRLIRKEEAAEVARYFHNKLVMVLKAYQAHPLMVVEAPAQDAVVLNLALVEIQPTNPFINTAGTVAGAFVPGGGLIKLAGTGSVAIEGYLTDVNTGELLEQFKDREADKSAPFTIKDFQEYAHVRVALDDWAMQLAELLATPLEHVVSDSLPFSLNPF